MGVLESCWIETVGLEAFPPPKMNPRERVASQIATCLVRVHESASGLGRSVRLPSVAELAMYFKCQPLEVLGAVYELEAQGYQAEIRDLHRPFLLEDMLRSRQGKSTGLCDFFQSVKRLFQRNKPIIRYT